MAEPFQHLAPETRRLLDQPAEERCKFLQIRRWIPYARANAILEMLDRLYSYEPNDRMPCALILGAANNGKSSLCKTFGRRHPPVQSADGIGLDIPLFDYEMPPNPTLLLMFRQMIMRFGSTYMRSETVPDLKLRVYGFMKDFNVRMITVDELNRIITLTRRQQNEILAEIRGFATALKIPVACFGTRAIANITVTDESYHTRFNPITLDRWEEGKEWRLLLAKFEGYLPFAAPSQLSSANRAQLIHDRTGGLLGEARDFLEAASIYGIANHCDHLTDDCFQKCDYVSPAHRAEVVRSLSA